MQTATDRDLDGIRARHERSGAVVQVVEDDLTGNYEGEELQRMRALRPPADRLAHLEGKHDQLATEVGTVRVALGELKGGMETLIRLGTAAEAERDRRSKQEADDRRQKEEAEREREKATADAARAAAAAELADRERRRTFVLRLVAALGVAIASILAALVVRGH